MSKKPNPLVSKPATILNAEKLNELGIVYHTLEQMGRPHVQMSARNWQRALKAGAVAVHE